MSRFCFLVPGHMPLAAAWVIGIFFVPFLFLPLGLIAGGTSVFLFLISTIMVGSAILVPFVAHVRRRRVWMWVLVAAWFLLLQMLTAVWLGPLFQPVTVLAAVYLAKPGFTGFPMSEAPARPSVIEATAVEVERDQPPPAMPEPAADVPATPEPATDPASTVDTEPTDGRTRPRPHAQRRPYRTHRRPRH